MRRALSLLAIGCAGLAAGCGGDADSDEEEIRRVVRDFATAVAAGNGERACRQLTGTGQRELVEAVTAAFPDPGDVGCEEAVGELSNDMAPERKTALLNPKVRDVEIVSDSAEVRLAGLGRPVRLSREDGNWQVAGSDVAG
ncbi:MAG TPA: hypothetical protein VGW75_08230 [Solirubrobacteraceae bacterium]|nr:hypothetical protein [Solirubrobacteraceae bacterium]